jgi:hypothetical protein
MESLTLSHLFEGGQLCALLAIFFRLGTWRAIQEEHGRRITQLEKESGYAR